jgi:branched-chain amino acid transport system substrate-binding protein
MADNSRDQHANVPEKEKSTTELASSAPEKTNLPTGLAKRTSSGIARFMRNPLRVLMVGSALILLLVIVLRDLSSFGLLFKPSGTPLIVTMVTSYNDRQKSPSQGLEAWQGAKLYIDRINQQDGGVNGHPILLQQLNDETHYTSDRSIADQVVQKSRSLLVLGPVYSAMVPSDVNRIYRDASLPLITASISSDALTRDNPFAFRLRTLTSSQGSKSATYVRQILGLRTASILRLQGDDAYGKPLAEAFTSTFTSQGGHIAQDLQITPDLKNIASTLVRDPGIVFLAMTDLQKARDVIVNLRENHVTAPILCSDAIDSDLFPTLFASNDFLNGIYASAPVIYDSAPDAAQTFASQYLHMYGRVPGWFGAMYYEAAQVAVQALRNAKVQGTPTSLSKDREAITQQLEQMDSTQSGVEGLNGLLYFDKHHNEGISQTRFGQFWHGRLRSLPIQLVAVSNPDLVDLQGQMRAGEIIKADDQYFWKQRVVYAGIDLNTVSSINVTTATFTVDFYLWMRYSGNDDAAAIAFTNASNVSFDPTQPQSSQVINDTTLPLVNQVRSGQRLQYRRYHITGDFKATYDFHDYPFDQQQLTIGFQNTRLTSEQLVYVIDAPGLRLNADNTIRCSDTAVFQSLSSWTCQDRAMQYASDTFSSSSTLGDPRWFDLRTQTDYSGLQVTMLVQRKAGAYLLSHLLPLVLLILLVYASLFLSLDHLGDRLTLTVSALLTSAVLLLSVNSELPDIGYGVSLDVIYYIFFGLCLLCTVIPMYMEKLHEKQHTIAVRRLNIGLHVIYLTVLVAMVAYYVATYGNRFV